MTDVMTLHDLLSMKNWAVAKNVTDANQDKFFDEWKRFLQMRETCEKKNQSSADGTKVFCNYYS